MHVAESDRFSTTLSSKHTRWSSYSLPQFHFHCPQYAIGSIWERKSQGLSSVSNDGRTLDAHGRTSWDSSATIFKMPEWRIVAG